MIIEGLFYVIYQLIDMIAIDLPNLPPSIVEYGELGFSYLREGVKLAGVFLPMDYLLNLLSLVILVDIGVGVYKLAMWIIRKLPVSIE